MVEAGLASSETQKFFFWCPAWVPAVATIIGMPCLVESGRPKNLYEDCWCCCFFSP